MRAGLSCNITMDPIRGSSPWLTFFYPLTQRLHEQGARLNLSAAIIARWPFGRRSGDGAHPSTEWHHSGPLLLTGLARAHNRTDAQAFVMEPFVDPLPRRRFVSHRSASCPKMTKKSGDAGSKRWQRWCTRGSNTRKRARTLEYTKPAVDLWCSRPREC